MHGLRRWRHLLSSLSCGKNITQAAHIQAWSQLWNTWAVCALEAEALAALGRNLHATPAGNLFPRAVEHVHEAQLVEEGHLARVGRFEAGQSATLLA